MPTYYNNDTVLYFDGEFQRAAEAKTDLFSQTLHYGYGVFEGIRSYRTASGETKIFKAVEHYERLKQSALALNLPYPYDTNELIEATYEVLKRNDLQNAYIRPLVFAPANMGFTPNERSHIVIAVWEMGLFLGDKCLRVMTSQWQRPNPLGFKIQAKATGHYVNSILASQDAKGKGFDEALLIDMNGHVAEGPGANMFYEKDGIVYTPPLGNILPGITRATVIEMCEELGVELVEKHFTPAELKTADSAFFCGTAAEIVGWDSLDDYKFPKAWDSSIGRQLQKMYKARVVEEGVAVS